MVKVKFQNEFKGAGQLSLDASLGAQHGLL